jgi:hypothetical protein
MERKMKNVIKALKKEGLFVCSKRAGKYHTGKGNKKRGL